jgi:hypothetical protein
MENKNLPCYFGSGRGYFNCGFSKIYFRIDLSSAPWFPALSFPPAFCVYLSCSFVLASVWAKLMNVGNFCVIGEHGGRSKTGSVIETLGFWAVFLLCDLLKSLARNAAVSVRDE